MSNKTQEKHNNQEGIQSSVGDNLLAALHQATEKQAAGNISEAEEAYEKILEQEPQQLNQPMLLQHTTNNLAVTWPSLAQSFISQAIHH